MKTHTHTKSLLLNAMSATTGAHDHRKSFKVLYLNVKWVFECVCVLLFIHSFIEHLFHAKNQ